MNKPLATALGISLALHASSLAAARQGFVLEILRPLEELKQFRQRESAMSFTFVESPSTQSADETPARKSNLISDKSTVAKDNFEVKQPQSTQTPHVAKPAAGKQVGRLMGQPQPPLHVPEQMPAPKQTQMQQRQTPGQSQPMKALKVQDEMPKQDERIKQEYLVKIKELQEKIDRATKQIQENEKILGQRKKMQEEEADLLRWQEERALQREEKQPQQAVSSRGKVGFGGASLHDASSDVQGDVDRFGEISFNASRYELGLYFRRLKTKVEEYWLPYLAFTYSGGNLFGNKTVIFFRIMPDGTVKEAKVLEHAGDELLKDFCLSAVQGTAPFDPLPKEYLNRTGYTYLPIVFTFNY